ncbi:MAG: molybdopterin-dependent oxidoreductase, partial [Planctomycetota bacterium]
LDHCRSGHIASLLLTGNYPSEWMTEDALAALGKTRTVLIDTHSGHAESLAEVVLASATFAEKAGTFENCDHVIQAFDQAIPNQHQSKSEGQIVSDLLAMLAGERLEERPPTFGAAIVDEQPGQVPGATDVVNLPRGPLFEAAAMRAEMAGLGGELAVFGDSVIEPAEGELVEPDMVMVEL